MSARVFDWMWVGPSGRRIDPVELAAHLDRAAGLLQREGWGPKGDDWEPKGFGIEQAVDAGDDLRTVAYRMAEHQLGIEIGVPLADLYSWERADVRTIFDVTGLLARTAAMVREQAVTR